MPMETRCTFSPFRPQPLRFCYVNATNSSLCLNRVAPATIMNSTTSIDPNRGSRLDIVSLVVAGQLS